MKPWNGPGSYPRSLKSSKDKRGLITEYLYDEQGNLSTLTLKGNDLTGSGDKEIRKNLSYNVHNLCISEETCDNKTLTSYDTLRPYLPIKIEKYCGQVLTGWMAFQFNKSSQIISEDCSGSITLWEYDSRGYPIKKINKTGTEDPDVITTFQYNHQGQCVEQVSSDTIIKIDYDIMGNLSISSIYDGSGKLISTKYNGYNLNNSLSWQMGLEPNDLVQIDYNFAGLPKVKRQLLTQASVDNAQTVKIKEAGAAYTLYDYDARGHLIQEVDPLGHCTYREYDRLGRVSKISNMNMATQYCYEAGGLVSETIYPNDSKLLQEYSTNGLLIKEIYPDGSQTIYKYDLFGRPILEEKNGITSTVEYDDATNKIIRKQQGVIFKIEEYNQKGHLIATTDAEGHIWKKTYDDLGRVKSDTDPEGNQTGWNYHGNSITCTLPSHEKMIQYHAAGKVVESQSFDPEGNLIACILSECSPDTNSYKEINGDNYTTTWVNTQGKPIAIEQEGIITIHHYDPNGKCLSTIDGEGRMTQKQYDPVGRLTQKTLPGGRVVTYEYDVNSNLIAATLPNNVVWKASYDLMGKKKSEELQAKGTTSQKWNYTYEQGRLKEAIDPNQLKHHYLYDAFGRIIEEQVDHRTGFFHVDHYKRLYTYDLRGSLLSGEQIGEDHTRLERSYDKAGKLIGEIIHLNEHLIQDTHQIWEPSKRTLQINDHQRSYSSLGGNYQITTPDITLDYRYDLNGSLKTRSTKHVSIDYQYHASGLPQMIQTQIGKESFEETMTWDKSAKMSAYASNWKGIQEEKQFSYNSHAQLKSVNDDEYHFDFDKPGCGVLTKSPHWTVAAEGLDPFGKIISEFNDDAWITTTYNVAGETISRTKNHETQTFKWDPWGNLIEMTSDVYLWKATYDVLGRRLQTQYLPKKGQSQTVISFYDPEKEFDEIGVKYDGKTFWKLIKNGNSDAMLDEHGNAVSLIHDALGKLIAVVDSEHIHWQEGLVTPYGPRDPPAPLQPDLVSFALAHSWQGRRVDPTGFIWMGARYYDPIGGKFLSADPIGISVSLDLYSYTNGDPINFNDPDGRFESPVYRERPMPIVCSFGIYEAIASPINRSFWFDLSGCGLKELPKGLGIGFINGIQNSFEDFKESLRHLSKLSGGYNIQGVYAASIKPTYGEIFGFLGQKIIDPCRSFVADLQTCLFGMAHVDTGRVEHLHAMWNAHFDQHPDGYFLQFYHSRGGIDVTNALLSYSEERRKRIISVGIAPAGYPYEGTCLKVTNYRVDWKQDLVPYIDVRGSIRAQNTITTLTADANANLSAHTFVNPTYDEPIQNNVSNFFKTYGKQ